MYSEIGEFVRNVGTDKRMWKDGEFWTAVLFGVAAGVWFYTDLSVIVEIRAHFSDLLSATSILFGFVLTTLFFYIQAASTWSNESKVREVALALVNHHVWTVFTLLLLIGYILGLWVVGRPAWWSTLPLVVSYAFLVFLVFYCGFQILNQILTVRWAFLRRDRLLSGDMHDAKSSHDAYSRRADKSVSEDESDQCQ